MLLVIARFFWPRRGLDDENVLTLRVLPNDADVTRVSCDRHFASMDLGRINIGLAPNREGLIREKLAAVR